MYISQEKLLQRIFGLIPLTIAYLTLLTLVSQIIALSAALAFGSSGHEKLQPANEKLLEFPPFIFLGLHNSISQ